MCSYLKLTFFSSFFGLGIRFVSITEDSPVQIEYKWIFFFFHSDLTKWDGVLVGLLNVFFFSVWFYFNSHLQCF